MIDILFNREEGNIGGIQKITFFATDEVNVFGDIINGEIFEILFLDNNIEPASLEIIPESSNFTESQKSYNLFEYEFTCKIAKDSLDKRTALLLFDNKKIIAKVTDNNNQSRLIGTPKNGCTTETKLEKGTSTADLNFYEIKFSWLSKFRAPFANELIIATADYSCSNPVVPNPMPGQNFTTSIDITNNTLLNYTATQTFTIEGIATQTISLQLGPQETKTFEVTFLIPEDAIGNYRLIRSGACNSEEFINIPNFANFILTNILIASTSTQIIPYDYIEGFAIDPATLTFTGDAIITADPAITGRNDAILVQNTGKLSNISFSDTAGNQYLIPCTEGYPGADDGASWTLHEVKQGKRFYIDGNHDYRRDINDIPNFYNLANGASKLTVSNGIIYVPYNENKQKIFNT